MEVAGHTVCSFDTYTKAKKNKENFDLYVVGNLNGVLGTVPSVVLPFAEFRFINLDNYILSPMTVSSSSRVDETRSRKCGQKRTMVFGGLKRSIAPLPYKEVWAGVQNIFITNVMPLKALIKLFHHGADTVKLLYGPQ